VAISAAVPRVDMTQGQRESIDVARLPTLGDMEKLGNLGQLIQPPKFPTRSKPHASNELGFLNPRDHLRTEGCMIEAICQPIEPKYLRVQTVSEEYCELTGYMQGEVCCTALQELNLPILPKPV
jgi:hypothetical protein